MTRLLIHVEGPTEEVFVNELLAPHLYGYNYTNVSARRMGSARQRDQRHGVKPWEVVKTEICNGLKQDSDIYATLMVDYYGMPSSTWPGRDEANHLSHDQKAIHIQEALLRDIQTNSPNLSRRFIPFVLMHEFEALLFSDCAEFAQGIYEPKLEQKFVAIRNKFESPEHINDSPLSAPSKRILELIPKYQKPINGTLAVLQIGLSAIRRECVGFNHWLTRLEDIGKSGT